jgi:hypothetical protein
MIANTPGSGSGDGNSLCGVGVVYLYSTLYDPIPIGECLSCLAIALLNRGQDMELHVQDLRRGERAISVIAPNKVSRQLVEASLQDGYTAK